MKVLVINAGSSSLKFQLIDMEGEKLIAKGNCECIGEEIGVISYKVGEEERLARKDKVVIKDHKEAFKMVIHELVYGDNKVVESLDEIGAVGHRVVQGGAVFSKSTLIDEDVIEKISDLGKLAPLHNPAHVVGMRACIEVLGDKVPQVAVFDTSFHQTMPEKAYMFAIPYEYYEKYQIRRYGAHGTSHRYVSAECANIMGKDIKDLKIITCHIGNGASITAVKNGEVIDTSMGLTPVDGFLMGTRCGSMDPSVLTYIAEKENMSFKEIDTMCNKKSGFLGISCLSNDSRTINDEALAGNKKCQLALEMQYYQITKFIGSYVAAMNGVDSIVFTAGIAENDPLLRKRVLENLTYLGIEEDVEANAVEHCKVNTKITTDNSKVAAYIIPTNEELVIARDTLEIVEAL
ncbi:MAG: acetate kinase [Clostridia bacterium]|nr:acetate kinase [Clostridia bacterium]